MGFEPTGRRIRSPRLATRMALRGSWVKALLPFIWHLADTSFFCVYGAGGTRTRTGDSGFASPLPSHLAMPPVPFQTPLGLVPSGVFRLSERFSNFSRRRYSPQEYFSSISMPCIENSLFHSELQFATKALR